MSQIKLDLKAAYSMLSSVEEFVLECEKAAKAEYRPETVAEALLESVKLLVDQEKRLQNLEERLQEMEYQISILELQKDEV